MAYSDNLRQDSYCNFLRSWATQIQTNRGKNPRQIPFIEIILAQMLANGAPFGKAADHPDITSRGPYRFVRHPMYLGELVFRAALLFNSNNLTLDFVLFALLTAIQCLRILREERWISGYQCYSHLVPWRLLPGIW